MKINWDATWEDILQQVQPTQEDWNRCSAVISSLENVLRHNWELSGAVQDIVTSGSYAKGTMLRERLEVDIVVFITNDYIRETCMKSFQDCISKMWQLGSDVKLNRHSVQFTHPRTTVELDMLFTYDLDAKSGFDVFLNRRGFQRQWSGKRKRNKTLTELR